jgi:hypothetical protein
MASKIRLADGREVAVALSGKRTAEVLEDATKATVPFVQFNSVKGSRIWINPIHVAAVEDAPELDAA